MLRRVLGLIILVIALVTVAVLLGGAYFVGQAVDGIGQNLEAVLGVTVDTLDNVSATLEQTKATVEEANNGLGTAVELAATLSTTVGDTQPLMENVTDVVTVSVPQNIEAVQTAIPNMAEVGGVIDTTMTRLSGFQISQTIPIPFNPITLQWDLGIDYDPAQPFDETIMGMGDSLEGMPENLRSLREQLEVITADLEVLSANLETSSGNLEAINSQVALFIPILDEYLRIVDQIKGSLLLTQGQLGAQLEMAKTGLIVILVFLALTQLTPLVVGWELLTGRRSRPAPEPVSEKPAPEVVVVQPAAPVPPVTVEQEEVKTVDAEDETVAVEVPAEDETVIDQPAAEDEQADRAA